MARRILTVLLALPLLSCDPATATVVLVGSSAASLAHTKKTIPDHIASWATGDDCSLVRYTEADGPYCLAEDAPAQADGEGGFTCYRTLGSIDCYSEPDPNASAFMEVK